MPMDRSRVRTLLRAPLAAGAVGALALGAPAAASAATTGGDWAGYVADSSTYTSVSASWVQPSVSCSGTTGSDADFWVGLDGYSDAYVEQIGTEVECSGGAAQYAAWYELYPASPVYLSQKLSPGDSVTATVSASTGNVFTLTLSDASAGWTASSKHTVSGAARSSAEIMLEVPSAGAGSATGGGSVSFTHALVNGVNLASADPVAVDSGAASCGPLLTPSSFTCTWNGISPAAAG
jgi:hypothetical protein